MQMALGWAGEQIEPERLRRQRGKGYDDILTGNKRMWNYTR